MGNAAQIGPAMVSEVVCLSPTDTSLWMIQRKRCIRFSQEKYDQHCMLFKFHP